MDGDYQQMYERVNDIHARLYEAVHSNTTQDAIRLEKESKQLLQDAEAGIPVNKMAKATYELEERYFDMSKKGNIMPQGSGRPIPRPPFNRGVEVHPPPKRDFYGKGPSWYKQDWK